MTHSTPLRATIALVAAALTLAPGCLGESAEAASSLLRSEANENMRLTASMETLGLQRSSEPHLRVDASSDGVRYLGLARAGEDPVLYTIGDDVLRGDELLSCGTSRRGLTCEPLDGSIDTRFCDGRPCDLTVVEPGPVPWDCDYEQGGNTCTCIGLIDCIKMMFSYACTQPMDCPEGGNECYCVGHGDI